MSGYPIQLAKVQPPPLRSDVLSRERLNGWLDDRTGHRIVLVIAEAGYGKTTLLADWARQTGQRTLWYRLDTDDRDWLTFLNHLVASGRQLHPTFGAEAEELIGSLGPGGPTRDAIVTSLVRELSEVAAGGATLIFDDFHAIDGTPEVSAIVRALVERTADRMSFLIASRQHPNIPLARIRALGKLAELSAEDLRFDLPETERLFREAYGRPLEPDVLSDLTERTEGWAASLQLVRTAIRDRSGAEVRTFVHRLSGARGELHDFLAEEVVGGLSGELQQFLMRSAVLEVVEPEPAAVAFPGGADEIPVLIRQSEALGLLSRRGSEEDSPYRFHPLVRDFLESRLTAELGEAGVRELHLTIARHFDGRDWRISATHYDRGGDVASVERVIYGSVSVILGQGEYRTAAELLGGAEFGGPVRLMLHARMELQHGEAGKAVAMAARAVTEAERTEYLPVALFNYGSILVYSGDHRLAAPVLERALGSSLETPLRQIAEVLLLLMSPEDPDIPAVVGRLERLIEVLIARPERHYLGITHLNLSEYLLWIEAFGATLSHAARAEEALMGSSSGFELVTTYITRAKALAALGEWELALSAVRQALEQPHPFARLEGLIETAEMFAWWGDAHGVREWDVELRELAPSDIWPSFLLSTRLLIAVRLRDHTRTQELLAVAERMESGEVADLSAGGFIPARTFRRRFAVARAHYLLESPEARVWLRLATETAEQQRATTALTLSRILAAAMEGPQALSPALGNLRADQYYAVSVLAEEVSPHLAAAGEAAVAVAASEARRRPARWLDVLRHEVSTAGSPWAAQLLAEMGEQSDVALLRRAAQRGKRGRAALIAEAGRLSRRTAPAVTVLDLGQVRISVGDKLLVSGQVRRKVLALICFLLAQPRASATRDQVLEALWPDLEPDTAVNSLNQTIYFLRRVLEPEYSEASSAGYIRYEGEMVWLDLDLVTSASRQLKALLFSGAITDDGRSAEQALELYEGRFAEDFAYEEWAESHRDVLHAAFLAVLERAIEADQAAGRHMAAIRKAQRVLEIDPAADGIEAMLLRLYRDSGANAAAAEQYAHYSAALRDGLGLEAPPLDKV